MMIAPERIDVELEVSPFNTLRTVAHALEFWEELRSDPRWGDGLSEPPCALVAEVSRRELPPTLATEENVQTITRATLLISLGPEFGGEKHRRTLNAFLLELAAGEGPTDFPELAEYSPRSADLAALRGLARLIDQAEGDN